MGDKELYPECPSPNFCGPHLPHYYLLWLFLFLGGSSVWKAIHNSFFMSYSEIVSSKSCVLDSDRCWGQLLLPSSPPGLALLCLQTSKWAALSIQVVILRDSEQMRLPAALSLGAPGSQLSASGSWELCSEHCVPGPKLSLCFWESGSSHLSVRNPICHPQYYLDTVFSKVENHPQLEEWLYLWCMSGRNIAHLCYSPHTFRTPPQTPSVK